MLSQQVIRSCMWLLAAFAGVENAPDLPFPAVATVTTRPKIRIDLLVIYALSGWYCICYDSMVEFQQYGLLLNRRLAQ